MITWSVKEIGRAPDATTRKVPYYVEWKARSGRFTVGSVRMHYDPNDTLVGMSVRTSIFSNHRRQWHTNSREALPGLDYCKEVVMEHWTKWLKKAELMEIPPND